MAKTIHIHFLASKMNESKWNDCKERKTEQDKKGERERGKKGTSRKRLSDYKEKYKTMVGGKRKIMKAE